MSIFSDNRGSVGMLSIIIMLVLGVLGASFIAVSSSEVNTSAGYRDGIIAQNLAEAGVNHAIVVLLNNNGTWPGDIPWTLLGSGDYKVHVNPSGSNREIQATGRVGNVTRRVDFTLTITTSNPQQQNSVYSNAIFSGSNMNLNNNAIVNGSVRSNSIVNLNNNARVTIDVVASSNVTRGNNSVVGGTVTTNAPAVEVPAYNRDNYSSAQSISNIDQKKTISLNGGVYYRDGGWTVENGATITGTGTIYIAGNVIFENNVTITGNVMIIAEGDINFHNNVSVNRGVLFSKQNINLDNNDKVRGSVVATGVINLNNNAIVTYDQTVLQQFGLGGGGGGGGFVTQIIPGQWGNNWN